MSNFTNHAENQLIDMLRGQGLTLPTDWYVGLLSAADDGTLTELSGVDYARVPVTRSMANWAGTQGAGTTLASTGTSHRTSNNIAVDFGIAGSNWGTATHVGLFADGSPAEPWMYCPIGSPELVINASDPVVLAAGSLLFTLGLSGGMTDYLANKLIDLIFRAQAYTWPATTYFALYTSAPSNAGGGTEVSAPGYSRPSIDSTMTDWAGTHAEGSTDASTGTNGRTTNNVEIAFPGTLALANWGTLTNIGQRDASSGGNLLFWAELNTPKTVNLGADVPVLPAASYSITFS